MIHATLVNEMKQASKIFLSIAALSLLGACGAASESPATDTVQRAGAARAEKPSPDTPDKERGSPGKPVAPISIKYQVVGKPVVGQPVSIDLQIGSAGGDRPVRVSYRARDASSLLFANAQPEEVEIGAVLAGKVAREQVTVIPQREGRVYLNVSASVETSQGTMYRSLAIPIQVGSAPEPASVNGELKQTEDGETVISMPAREN